MRDVPWAISGYVAASRYLKLSIKKNLDGEKAAGIAATSSVVLQAENH
jgi:hypothetical protein